MDNLIWLTEPPSPKGSSRRQGLHRERIISVVSNWDPSHRWGNDPWENDNGHTVIEYRRFGAGGFNIKTEVPVMEPFDAVLDIWNRPMLVYTEMASDGSLARRRAILASDAAEVFWDPDGSVRFRREWLDDNGGPRIDWVRGHHPEFR